jgi:hypothetical protein
VSGALQQGFCWGFNLLRGWACIASFCDWVWKHNEGFCWGLFCMCLGFLGDGVICAVQPEAI